MRFVDILYGTIDLPEWLIPFLKIPEFVRLRGVRLSNVDSFEFKDFNGPSRWEHGVGVAHLAFKFSKKKKLSEFDTVHLVLAALLHDVATPPFAHTIEYVLEGYNHELESNKILSYNYSDNTNPTVPIFASQLPKFHEECQKLSKLLKLKIDPHLVADMVTGGGELGYLINGSIDLDNIDNVSRASLFMGIDVDKQVPYKLLNWLSSFDKVPTEVESETNEAVKEWLAYKNKMYTKFFTSSEEELGRQAFLQHLIRRAYKEGMSRNKVIWNTDEGLLNDIEKYDENHIKPGLSYVYNYQISLKELVEQYRLLKSPIKIIEISIDNKEQFKIAQNPAFANWLEDELTTSTFEPFVIINAKRYSEQDVLFKKEGGLIQVYKTNTRDLKYKQLPEWAQNKICNENKIVSTQMLNEIAKEKVRQSLKSKPWQKLTVTRKENIKANLENVESWGFRLSRNESLHSYPATFVHALPATLITALGLRGDLIVDPFGGTGQTASEAIKLGCKAISSDNNTIATMVAKVKLTYLSQRKREIIRSLERNMIECRVPIFFPKVENIGKWHHIKTQEELSKILSFIEAEEDGEIKLFFKVCFSDILTSCTARKGREHNYFADNTPLSKAEASPTYENAISLFLNKARKNVSILEKFYLRFQVSGSSPREELSNAQVRKIDIKQCNLSDFDLQPKSVGGIITSPPYLCMADYTLGQRLSYYWLYPQSLNEDFNNEIAPRRNRIKKQNAIKEYFEDISIFASKAYELLKEHGFLVTVIGAPIAEAYKEGNILKGLDSIFQDQRLELFWETNRRINWHRNHGFARLKEERIAIYIKR